MSATMAKQLRFFRICLRSTLLACFLAVPGVTSLAQENKVKAPESKYGFELRVRKAGEDKFDDKTRKFGIEVFVDPNMNKVVYISETGSIAVLPAAKELPSGKGKDPAWQHAMELRVRKAGEKDFTKDTKKYGLEVFRDENNGNLIYITETGSIAVVPGGAETVAKSKAPEWKHAMELRARKAGEKEFTATTKAFGIEVFRDENNGNLIYITDVGTVAVLTGAPALGDKVKKPDWKHAMELRVRKGGDPDFNDKTPKLGMEVFLDTNVGKLIYLSETGGISVPATVQSGSTDKAPDWKYGLDLRARKAGEAEFTGATKRYGIEVFLDGNTDSLIYISETGSVTDLPAK
jgi:hypothetical protein